MLTTSSHSAGSARNKHDYIYGIGKRQLRDEEFLLRAHSNSVSFRIIDFGYRLPGGNPGSNID